MPVHAGFMHGMGRGQGSLFGAVLRRRLLCKARPAYKKVQAACTKGLDISQRKVYVYNIVI